MIDSTPTYRIYCISFQRTGDRMPVLLIYLMYFFLHLKEHIKYFIMLRIIFNIFQPLSPCLHVFYIVFRFQNDHPETLSIRSGALKRRRHNNDHDKSHCTLINKWSVNKRGLRCNDSSCTGRAMVNI